jgi:hypothetical protein
MLKITLDGYAKAAVAAEARTGRREVKRTFEALDGKAPFTAEARVLLTLARKGLINLHDVAKTFEPRHYKDPAPALAAPIRKRA